MEELDDPTRGAGAYEDYRARLEEAHTLGIAKDEKILSRGAWEMMNLDHDRRTRKRDMQLDRTLIAQGEEPIGPLREGEVD